MDWKKAGIWTERPDDFEAVYYGKLLHANSFRWVAVKLHDGLNVVPEVASALHNGWHHRMAAQGITVGGWGVNLTEPEEEATLVHRLVSEHKLGFYIADAEAAHKADSGGDPHRSIRFVNTFRQLLPTTPAAMSTYGAASGDNVLGRVSSDVGPMFFRPWYRAGFRLLPQAYPNQYGEVYSLERCMAHSLSAGYPLSWIHLVVGNYGGWHADQYVDDLHKILSRWHRVSRGFSLFLAESTSEQDIEAYGRAIRKWGLADT